MSKLWNWLARKGNPYVNDTPRSKDEMSRESRVRSRSSIERRENKMRKILEDPTADFHDLRNLC